MKDVFGEDCARQPDYPPADPRGIDDASYDIGFDEGRNHGRLEVLYGGAMVGILAGVILLLVF